MKLNKSPEHLSVKSITLAIISMLLLFIALIGLEENYQITRTEKIELDRALRVKALQLQDYFGNSFDRLNVVFNRTNTLDLAKLMRVKESVGRIDQNLTALYRELNKNVIFGSYDIYLIGKDRIVKNATLPMDVGLDFHGYDFAMKIFDLVEKGEIPYHVSQPFYLPPTGDFRRYLLTLSKNGRFFVQISHNYFPVESIAGEIGKIRKRNPGIKEMEAYLLVSGKIVPMTAKEYRNKKKYFKKLSDFSNRFVMRMDRELGTETISSDTSKVSEALQRYFEIHRLAYRIDPSEKEATIYSVSENIFNDKLNKELILLRVRYDLAPIFYHYRKYRIRLLLILALSLMMIFGVFYILRKYYLDPLRRMIRALEKEEEIHPENLCIREFIQLGEAINHYRKKLQLRTKELERLSLVDPLTGTYNRRYFSKMIEEHIYEHVRYGRKFALLIFDIDNFKRINDRYGHDVGDEVLKELTERIRQLVRQSDLFFRIGGEEFALILSPVEALEDAVLMAEKIREHIAAKPLSQGVRVTISVGVAIYRAEDDVASIYKRADNFMYQSKQKGKNRVTSLNDFGLRV